MGSGLGVLSSGRRNFTTEFTERTERKIESGKKKIRNFDRFRRFTQF